MLSTMTCRWNWSPQEGDWKVNEAAVLSQRLHSGYIELRDSLGVPQLVGLTLVDDVFCKYILKNADRVGPTYRHVRRRSDTSRPKPRLDSARTTQEYEKPVV